MLPFWNALIKATLLAQSNRNKNPNAFSYFFDIMTPNPKLNWAEQKRKLTFLEVFNQGIHFPSTRLHGELGDDLSKTNLVILKCKEKRQIRRTNKICDQEKMTSLRSSSQLRILLKMQPRLPWRYWNDRASLLLHSKTNRNLLDILDFCIIRV